MGRDRLEELEITDINHAMISKRFEVVGLVFVGYGFDIPK
jgi:dTDP-glucose pyrophosphorylase